jgi:hypothetical protein
MACDMTSSSQSADARRTYQDPIARLLDYGECYMAGGGPADLEWLDYVSDLGLTPEHVPDLIRLACDATLHTAEAEDPAVWAPTHAWRALGQLRAVEAVAPLLELLRGHADDDWVDIELPYVFGLIGPGAIPHVTDSSCHRLSGRSIRSHGTFDHGDKMPEGNRTKKSTIPG